MESFHKACADKFIYSCTIFIEYHQCVMMHLRGMRKYRSETPSNSQVTLTLEYIQGQMTQRRIYLSVLFVSYMPFLILQGLRHKLILKVPLHYVSMYNLLRPNGHAFAFSILTYFTCTWFPGNLSFAYIIPCNINDSAISCSW